MVENTCKIYDARLSIISHGYGPIAICYFRFFKVCIVWMSRQYISEIFHGHNGTRMRLQSQPFFAKQPPLVHNATAIGDKNEARWMLVVYTKGTKCYDINHP